MSEIFLTGHRKAGTSMLAKLFDGHSQVSLYPTDVSLLYAYIPNYVVTVDDPDLRRDRIGKVISKSLRYSLEGKIGETELANLVHNLTADILGRLPQADLDSRVKVFSAFVETWRNSAIWSKGSCLVFKETSQVVHSAEYLSRYPEMKIINLVRDPRDNYAAIKAGVTRHYSTLGEGEMESLASVINRYRVDVIAAMTASDEFPENVKVIKFEDLVSAPSETMHDVSDFCGLEYQNCLINPTEFGKAYAGNNHDGKVMSGISGNNLGRWNERISPFEAKVIEFFCASEMEKSDYPLFYSKSESKKAFAQFYDWYNHRYFYRDSFQS